MKKSVQNVKKTVLLVNILPLIAQFQTQDFHFSWERRAAKNVSTIPCPHP